MNRTLTGDVQYNNGELGISQCVWCRHRSAGGRHCRAFPKGIPEAIIKNRHDHRSPFNGDYGVRFEPEVFEIEFVGVESESDSVPLSAELAVALARVGNADPPTESAEVVVLDGAEVEAEYDAAVMGAAASG